jgi:hypothetical protein
MRSASNWSGYSDRIQSPVRTGTSGDIDNSID